MIHDFGIREHNVQAHFDIEEEINLKQNGQFTFIIRVNNGNIVDLVVMEYANSSKYLIIEEITTEEYTIAHDSRNGSATNAIRPDNIQREFERRGSTNT